VSKEIGCALYLCAIKDGYSHRLVGYAVGAHMTARLATAALRAALARRRPGRVVIVHSDRGSQLRSRLFRAALEAAGLQGSMGRVAAAGDNAAMKSFFSLLQKNVLNRHPWATRDQLHTEIVYWIEHTYHRRRRQRALGKRTPIEYELAFALDEDANAA
jgi:transposase InsO family protein